MYHNMITGASQADIGYEEIVSKMSPFFKSFRYNVNKDVCSWFDGQCLFEALDGIEVAPLDPNGPFRYHICLGVDLEPDEWIKDSVLQTHDGQPKALLHLQGIQWRHHIVPFGELNDEMFERVLAFIKGEDGPEDIKDLEAKAIRESSDGIWGHVLQVDRGGGRIEKTGSLSKRFSTRQPKEQRARTGKSESDKHGEVYHPLGLVDFRVTMGEPGRSKMVLMEFVIIKCHSLQCYLKMNENEEPHGSRINNPLND
ncbi:hypothetical protein Tco_0454757 [Tanacetum coccineum]